MSTHPTSRIGLIAGAGEIPVYFARKAQQNGTRLVAIGFTDEIQSELKPFVENSYSIGVGKPSKILKILKQENIQEVIVLGKVNKEVIFRPQLFDLRAIKFLASLKSKDDKTLLLGVMQEFEKEGFRVMDQKEFLGEIFPESGVLSRRSPSKKEMQDVEYGLPIAKQIADAEIGQTLIVKDKTVIAVEAIEGTDRAIERGCALSKGGCTVIKVSRTNQDYRFDSPGIGPQTMEGLVKGGASVLALEAGRVMVVDQPKVVALADQAGLSVLCV